MIEAPTVLPPGAHCPGSGSIADNAGQVTANQVRASHVLTAHRLHGDALVRPSLGGPPWGGNLSPLRAATYAQLFLGFPAAKTGRWRTPPIIRTGLDHHLSIERCTQLQGLPVFIDSTINCQLGPSISRCRMNQVSRDHGPASSRQRPPSRHPHHRPSHSF
jgi:hypothetical protein